MQVPLPSNQHAVPDEPPGIYEQADKETARRFQHPGVYEGVRFAYELDEDLRDPVYDAIEEKKDISRELGDATDRLTDEADRPVIDRRKERDRSRNKRGR
ncbi:MAG TPA: hypothetical protein VG164_11555 [Trebonia sp.]|nr:hypothetical protein [Trebonia sp.]